jgi:hypothetical protein
MDSGAIMQEGIMKGGLNPKMEIQPGAFKEPIINIERGAVEIPEGIFKEPILKVEKGAVEIKDGAFKGPVIEVKPEAVKFVIESGAINVHEGAININLTGKKPPFIDVNMVREALNGLKPLGTLEGLSDDVKIKIIGNEKIMQSAIKAILDAIDVYNLKYADPPKSQ